MPHRPITAFDSFKADFISKWNNYANRHKDLIRNRVIEVSQDDIDRIPFAITYKADGSAIFTKK